MSYIQAIWCGKAFSYALSSGYLLQSGGLPVGLIEKKYSRRHSDDGTGQNMWETSHKNAPTTNHLCSLKPDTSKTDVETVLQASPCAKTFALQYMLGFL